MDKILFKAQGVCSDKRQYFELIKMQKRHKDRKLRPILLVCAALSLAFCIYDIIIIEYALATMSIGFVFLLTYSTTFSYMFDAQKMYETDKNRLLNVTLHFVFYDNRFSVTMRDKESFYSYNKINDVRQSKHKIYFFTENNVFYIDKKKLDGVTAAEVKEHLDKMRKK